MRPKAIHQLIPSLATRDAIGSHTLATQDLLRHMGFESEIYAGDFPPELADRAKSIDSFDWAPRRARRGSRSGDSPSTWLLYQCSIGSVIADLLLDRPEPVLINYHNITPASLLEEWEPAVCHGVNQGRHQLAKLSGVARAAIAVSRFNELELIQAGYRRTAVAPLLLDLDSFVTGVDADRLARLAQAKATGGSDWLFVGRLSPHKAQHDLIKALAAYRTLYDPRARLHLVGGMISESYQRALVGFAAALGLADAVDFAGSVTEDELGSYFASADVLVSASEHEGFCVPLLEAMAHGLPVLAYAAGAVPETVASAGILVTDKSPLALAAAAHRLACDADLRSRVVRAGHQRVEHFAPERTRSIMVGAIESAIESVPRDKGAA